MVPQLKPWPNYRSYNNVSIQRSKSDTGPFHISYEPILLSFIVRVIIKFITEIYNPDTSSIFICLLACRSTYEMYKIYLNTCSRFFVGCCVVHFFDATSSQPNHAVLPFMLRIISIAGLVEDFCNKVLITDNELGRYKKKPAR